MELESLLDEAEAKAWASLARYKFMMFGYWAAIWVHLNRVGGFNRPSPFKPLVGLAKLGWARKTVLMAQGPELIPPPQPPFSGQG